MIHTHHLIIIYLFVLSSLIACSSKKIEPKANQNKISKNQFDLPAVIEQGTNEQPNFYKDGEKFLFISSNRANHKNPQIYEYALSTKTERRITFQDGKVQNPAYLTTDWIVYDSTTDEIKEAILEKNKASSEIYLSDLSGDQIFRLTDRQGLDQRPITAQKKEKVIYYIQQDNNLRSIMMIKFNSFPDSSKTSVFYSSKDSNPLTLVLNTDETWLFWNEYDETKNISKIYRKSLSQKPPELVLSIKGNIHSFQKLESENYFLLSFQHSQNSNYQLAILDSSQKCRIKIYESKNKISELSYLPKSPAAILMTLESNGAKGVFQLSLKNELGPCEPIEIE